MNTHPSFSKTEWMEVKGTDGEYEIGNLVCARSPLLQTIHRKKKYLFKRPSREKYVERTILYTTKIPYELCSLALSFFREIWCRYRSEGMVFLYYSPYDQGEWNIVAPEQYVSRYYVQGVHPNEPIPSGWYLAGSIHSHGSEPAFHSKQDTKDEQNKSGIHITFGDIESPFPQCSSSVMIREKRFLIRPETIIEYNSAFPLEWLEEVHPIPRKKRGGK